jgi:hypothetical protein
MYPTEQSTKQTPTASRALWLGIAFSLALTALIWAFGGLLDRFALEPDRPGMWYAWQSPNPLANVAWSAWVLYLIHQIGFWVLIYRAQQQSLKYTHGLHPLNYWALAWNGAFSLIHLAQTHLFYDGLAADVPEWTSQWSVILLLCMVLHIENQRRGLVLGKKWNWLTESGRLVRKYHGYYFAWAIVYTFWYHPMVSTSGHLIGFFYMFMLILQGSLFFTRVHTNRWWMFTQEILVLVHAVLVSLMNVDGMWPMFLFGFFGMLVFTQMFGIPLPNWGRWLILGVYVGGVLLVYVNRGWHRLFELVMIPFTLYAVVIVMGLLILAGLAIARKFTPKIS